MAISITVNTSASAYGVYTTGSTGIWGNSAGVFNTNPGKYYLISFIADAGSNITPNSFANTLGLVNITLLTSNTLGTVKLWIYGAWGTNVNTTGAFYWSVAAAAGTQDIAFTIDEVTGAALKPNPLVQAVTGTSGSLPFAACGTNNLVMAWQFNNAATSSGVGTAPANSTVLTGRPAGAASTFIRYHFTTNPTGATAFGTTAWSTIGVEIEAFAGGAAFGTAPAVSSASMMGMGV